jgi:two-component system chemotaxis response regulator CheY
MTNHHIKKDIKVLVVDDATGSRKMLIKRLRDLGLEKFTEASDGLDALQQLEKLNGSIDLIISDVNMPNMNGVELLRSVRSKENTKRIPFVIISAEVEKKVMLESMSLGVNNYIIKPFENDDLVEKLEQIESLHT